MTRRKTAVRPGSRSEVTRSSTFLPSVERSTALDPSSQERSRSAGSPFVRPSTWFTNVTCATSAAGSSRRVEEDQRARGRQQHPQLTAPVDCVEARSHAGACGGKPDLAAVRRPRQVPPVGPVFRQNLPLAGTIDKDDRPQARRVQLKKGHAVAGWRHTRREDPRRRLVERRPQRVFQPLLASDDPERRQTCAVRRPVGSRDVLGKLPRGSPARGHHCQRAVTHVRIARFHAWEEKGELSRSRHCEQLGVREPDRQFAGLRPHLEDRTPLSRPRSEKPSARQERSGR